MREIPVGTFTSPACKAIIVDQFPEHPSANMDGSRFGTYFMQEIWPLLEMNGVKLAGTRPRKYEMTQAAKFSVIG